MADLSKLCGTRYYVLDIQKNIIVGHGMLTKAEANAFAKNLSASNPYSIYKVICK